jgi:hypothetical protein
MVIDRRYIMVVSESQGFMWTPRAKIPGGGPPPGYLVSRDFVIDDGSGVHPYWIGSSQRYE